jgi:glutaconate CoA-transferase subunit B
VRVADVQAATGWELRIAAAIDETPPPTEEELRVLRELEAARPSGIG